MAQHFGSEHDTKVTLEASRTGIVEEPPFHILAAGDWSGDAEKRAVGERRVIEIDRDNFDEIMARLGVRADLELADGNSLSLEFNSLDAFHPDEIFRRVSVFGELRDIRKRLNSEDSFYSAAREVRAMFESETAEETPKAAEPETAEEPAADNLLDAILTKPAGGAPVPKPKVSGDLGNLIGELVRPHLVSVDEDERGSMLAAVDGATSELMRTILHNERFRELEAAWRGLFLLVRGTETSSELKIFIFDISKNELAEELRSAESLAKTTLYRHLVENADEPWAAVLANYSYEPNVDDTAALIRFGKIAAAANAPIISHVGPGIFGFGSLSETDGRSAWNIAADSDEGKLWAALRTQPEAAYIGLAMPRFLARLPYGRETEPAETFDLEEFSETFGHEDYCWANPCFAVGLLLTRSFGAYGWEMNRALMQDVEGLPVHVHKQNGETVFKPCSEVLISESGSNMILGSGIMPLVSFKNTDRCKLLRFQSVSDPTSPLKGPWE